MKITLDEFEFLVDYKKDDLKDLDLVEDKEDYTEVSKSLNFLISTFNDSGQAEINTLEEFETLCEKIINAIDCYNLIIIPQDKNNILLHADFIEDDD